MARARSPQACFICVCEWSKYKRLACNVSPTLRWTRKARKAIEPIQKRMNATKPKPSILGSRRSPTLRKISRILICYNLPYFLLIIPFNYYVIFFHNLFKRFPWHWVYFTWPSVSCHLLYVPDTYHICSMFLVHILVFSWRLPNFHGTIHIFVNLYPITPRFSCFS